MTTQHSQTYSLTTTLPTTPRPSSKWRALLLGAALAVPALAADAYAQTAAVPVSPEAVVTPTDDYAARLAQAEALLREQRPSDSLQLLEQAGAERQTPRLYLLKARAYRGLGMLAEARSHYQRYLTASQVSDADEGRERSQAEAEIRELNRIQQLTEPVRPAQATDWELSSGAGMVPIRVETRKHHRGMLAAGISLLSIGYFPALVCGSLFLTENGSSAESRAFRTASGLLLLPVIGPLASSIYAATSYKAETMLYWGLPWVLVDGAMQAAGLGLIIKGYRTPQKRVVLGLPGSPTVSGLKLSEVRLSTMALMGGGGLTVQGRF